MSSTDASSTPAANPMVNVASQPLVTGERSATSCPAYSREDDHNRAFSSSNAPVKSHTESGPADADAGATTKSQSPMKRRRRARKLKTIPFTSKLVSLFHDEPELIKWDNGDIFIPEPKLLETKLPNYFRSGHYTSFQRQLNNFGYNKVDKASGPKNSRYVKVKGEAMDCAEDLLKLRPIVTAHRKRRRESEESKTDTIADVQVVVAATSASRQSDSENKLMDKTGIPELADEHACVVSPRHLPSSSSTSGDCQRVVTPSKQVTQGMASFDGITRPSATFDAQHLSSEAMFPAPMTTTPIPAAAPEASRDTETAEPAGESDMMPITELHSEDDAMLSNVVEQTEEDQKQLATASMQQSPCKSLKAILASHNSQRRIMSLMSTFMARSTLSVLLSPPVVMMTTSVSPPIEVGIRCLCENDAEPSSPTSIVETPLAPIEYESLRLPGKDDVVPTPPLDLFDKEYFVSDEYSGTHGTLLTHPMSSADVTTDAWHASTGRASKRKATGSRRGKTRQRCVDSSKSEIILRILNHSKLEDSTIFRDFEALTNGAGNCSEYGIGADELRLPMPAPIPSDGEAEDESENFYSSQEQTQLPMPDSVEQQRNSRKRRSGKGSTRIAAGSSRPPQRRVSAKKTSCLGMHSHASAIYQHDTTSKLGPHADSLFAAENLEVGLSDSDVSASEFDLVPPLQNDVHLHTCSFLESFQSDYSLFGIDEISTLQNIFLGTEDDFTEKDAIFYENTNFSPKMTGKAVA